MNTQPTPAAINLSLHFHDVEIRDENALYLKIAQSKAQKKSGLIDLTDEEIKRLSSIGYSLVELNEDTFKYILRNSMKDDFSEKLSNSFLLNKDSLIRRWVAAKLSPTQCMLKFKIDYETVTQLGQLSLTEIHQAANTKEKLFTFKHDFQCFSLASKSSSEKEMAMLGALYA